MVEIEPTEIDKIKTATEANDPFFDWIYEKYRSRDGFNSYMPYTKTSYLDALSCGVGAMLSKAVCMYLMYVYECDVAGFEIERDVYQYELITEVYKHGGWDNYVYDTEYGVKVVDYYDFGCWPQDHLEGEVLYGIDN
jgi:hypothetical protein